MIRQLCRTITCGAVALCASGLVKRYDGVPLIMVVNADDAGEPEIQRVSDDENLPCKTIDDVDEVTCKVESLSLEALREACTRLGLSVEKQIFPYLFNEDGDADEIELDPNAKLEDEPIATDRTHADYVKAAIECLSIEEEMENMVLDEDEDLQSLFEQELMDHDPDMLSEIMSELLSNDPNLLAQVETIIKEEDPELYQELLKELSENGEGEGSESEEGGTMLDSLKARPDLVAEILTQMIMEDPSLLEDMEGEIFDDVEDGEEGMDAYFNLNDEEPDDEDAEDLETIKRHMASAHDEM